MKGWLWGPVLAAGLGVMLAGCGQKPGPISSGTGAASSGHLPFEQASESHGTSPTRAFASIAVPAGTSLIIRLQAPLSSANAHAGDIFKAVLDEPVMMQDQSLAPRGALLTGKVIAAQPSRPDEPGYLRLTLSTLVLDSKTLELRTSSLFAKGATRTRAEAAISAPVNDSRQFAGSGNGASRSDARFSTGRRLTFHLIDSLPLHD
jgi:hypothetical protein